MELKEKLKQHLDLIYSGYSNSELANGLWNKIQAVKSQIAPKNQTLTEKDVILITYGDSITSENQKPLQSLMDFVQTHLSDVFSSIHILPFFPSSSDDGFSVIDYKKVDPILGDWANIHELSAQYRIMSDLVINHASQKSVWFQNYLKGIDPGKDYFIEGDPKQDYSLVVRPRSLPLLTPFETSRGAKFVWTTFSADQIDLNFSNQALLTEMIDVFLYYILQGVSIVRLDAIAFIWKKVGTNCLHLPETHQVVKLLRDIAEFIDPSIVLITETNVPNKENLSYFRSNDEAHMVYNFSLPPLILYSLFSGNSSYLTQWASSLPDLAGNCTFLNFTASHDGVGVRPLEGILPDEEFEQLLTGMKDVGGFINTRRNTEGKDIPYELNITYFDALKGTNRGVDTLQIDRFICSQTIMLSMKGIPAVYINSILGGSNYTEGVRRTGMNRTINRQKWSMKELNKALKNHTVHSIVMEKLSEIIKIRKLLPEFHPNANQQIVDLSSTLFIVKRNNGKLVSVSNISKETQRVNPDDFYGKADKTMDLLTGMQVQGIIPLEPYQTVWLKAIE